MYIRFQNLTFFLEHEDSCIILHRQEISVDVGDSVMEINSDRNVRSQKLMNTKNDVNVSIQVKYKFSFLYIYIYVQFIIELYIMNNLKLIEG